MFAVIETGGKQYKVKPGDKLRIEKVNLSEKEEVVFDKVLLKAENGEVLIGYPYLAGAAVKGEVLRQGRGAKKIVFRYHSKTRYRKKKGHRQPFTEVLIKEI
jgi:large subunit ribosomal protein L21